MKNENILDFIVSLTASSSDPEFRSWSALILEIGKNSLNKVYYIMRERTVDDIILKVLYYCLLQSKSSSELGKMLQKETMLLKKQTAPTRHARFGGTFSLKTGGGAEIHVRKLPNPNNIQSSFDQGKKSKPINQRSKINNLLHCPIIKNESRKAYLEFITNFLDNGLTSTFSFNKAILLCIKKNFDVQLDSVRELDYRHFFLVLDFSLENYFKTIVDDEKNFDMIMGLVDPPVVLFIFRRMQIYRDNKVDA
jgi:hypothetical protein